MLSFNKHFSFSLCRLKNQVILPQTGMGSVHAAVGVNNSSGMSEIHKHPASMDEKIFTQGGKYLEVLKQLTIKSAYAFSFRWRLRNSRAAAETAFMTAAGGGGIFTTSFSGEATRMLSRYNLFTHNRGNSSLVDLIEKI